MQKVIFAAFRFSLANCYAAMEKRAGLLWKQMTPNTSPTQCVSPTLVRPLLQNGMKTHKTRDLMPILQALIHHTRASGSTEQVETRALSALLDVCDRTERIL